MDSSLYTFIFGLSHFVLLKHVLFLKISLYLFSNQIKLVVNHSARCCRVWCEYEMILKLMPCKPGKHPKLCVHLTVLPNLPQESRFHGDLSVSRLKVCVCWRHSVFPWRDSQSRDVHRYMQPTWQQLEPCLVYVKQRFIVLFWGAVHCPNLATLPSPVRFGPGFHSSTPTSNKHKRIMGSLVQCSLRFIQPR